MVESEVNYTAKDVALKNCSMCGECCTFFTVELPQFAFSIEKDKRHIFNDLVRFFGFHGCELLEHKYKDKHIPILKIPIRCSRLTRNNKCSVHRAKPICCSNFPQDEEYLYLLKKCTLKRSD